MAEVRKLATTILVGNEAFETNPMRLWLEDTWSAALREMEMTRLHGPLLGPGRNELWRIEAPARRRRQIRANVQSVMPGKRAGLFIPSGRLL